MQEMKEKIHDHAAKMLTSEVRGILKSKSAVSPIATNSPSPEYNPESTVFPTILKNNISKEFRNKQNSSSEDEGVSSESSSESSENENNGKIDKKNDSSNSEKENSYNEIERNNKKNVNISVFMSSESELSNENLGYVHHDFEVLNKSVIENEVFSDNKEFNIVRKHLEEVQIIDSSTEGTPQTSDGESSGGREVKHIISNEAVARRRQAAINRQKEKWVHISIYRLKIILQILT